MAVEMEAAALFTLGARLGSPPPARSIVTDVFEDGERRRIGDEELSEAVERMGAVAAAALAGLNPELRSIPGRGFARPRPLARGEARPAGG